MLQKILVLHGPNLNLLGKREPAKYGHVTLVQLNDKLKSLAKQGNVSLSCLQHNAEHEMLNTIHAAAGAIDFIIINAAGLAHSSIALRDALLGVGIPFIEVHMTNIHAREAFRQISYLSDIALGVITGLGVMSYELALNAAIGHLQAALKDASLNLTCEL